MTRYCIVQLAVRLSVLAATIIAVTAGVPFAQAAMPERPNILLIMTDDQGWGDFGFHGNPHLKTPHLDRLASQSTELTQFYVSPVCSPTRASLMTGRYNFRTGAIDTYMGRSSMAPDETTLAEMLSTAGYRTGIFGKWHLGDNYPTRAMDQGFSEALVHRGGGVGQPSDPPGNTYFNPVLQHNGRDEPSMGYCSDVFTDAAMRFIAEKRPEPFFAYLAFNCPHTPLQVPESYEARYRGLGLDADTAKLYGMVANIDDNVGRLLAKLSGLGLDDRTIVVFLTDNGPQVPRYNGTLRGVKGSVYDGGIHVPCLLRWPGKFTPGRKCDAVTAHIDLAPTLLAACGVAAPAGLRMDGVNLLPLLLGQQASLPDRLLFFQTHRGNVPEPGRNCAVRGPRYKLLQPNGRGERDDAIQHWELYDMQSDPAERTNLIEALPDVAASLKAAYDAWLSDVSSTRGYPVPKIIVGTRHENPLTLSRQDWRDSPSNWGPLGAGHWTIEVASPGRYQLIARLPAAKDDRPLELRIGDEHQSAVLPQGADKFEFPPLELSPGVYRVEVTAEADGKRLGAHYVDVLWKDPQSP